MQNEDLKHIDPYEFAIQQILSIKKEGHILIGIDGIDGSGKSKFAQSLSEKLGKPERSICNTSIDFFHYPKDTRYRRGRDSAEGFYRDSYDYRRFIDQLLIPIKEQQSECIIGIFDSETNSSRMIHYGTGDKSTIFIIDGIFLQRPELADYWDLVIFLDVDFQVALQRNIERTREKINIGNSQAIMEMYTKRYIPGQEMYFLESNPKENADIVIDNNDYTNPILTYYNHT